MIPARRFRIHTRGKLATKKERKKSAHQADHGKRQDRHLSVCDCAQRHTGASDTFGLLSEGPPGNLLPSAVSCQSCQSVRPQGEQPRHEEERGSEEGFSFFSPNRKAALHAVQLRLSTGIFPSPERWAETQPRPLWVLRTWLPNKRRGQPIKQKQ